MDGDYNTRNKGITLEALGTSEMMLKFNQACEGELNSRDEDDSSESSSSSSLSDGVSELPFKKAK